MSHLVRSLLAGLMLGIALSFIGFGSWDEVHAMFEFRSLRLTLTFGTAVAILVPAFAWLKKRRGVVVAPRPIHRGTVAGGLVFGAGWALCGACPGIAFVQLGQGQLGGLVALAGMFAGNALFSAINARYLHVPAASCAES